VVTKLSIDIFKLLAHH